MFEELSPPYATIVADPPWSYGADDQRWPHMPQTPGVWRRVERKPIPYSTMDTAAIAALPVVELAARDCWLFLWATSRHLPDALSVIEAWGFVYRQVLVWRKTEFVVVAARGKPPVASRLSSSVFEAQRSRHSRKPAVVLDGIERAVAGPYLELFARAPRLGWDSWGHGYELGEVAS